jgi:glycosyltransferase involved in cell wall biosynthesis/GT2 family glycosyltransferase
MDKKVSIVIPTYNRKYTLEMVIDSYLGQKYLHELIFIDDGSTDGTYEYLQKQAESHPFIKIKRHEKTRGVSNSRNEGIDLVRGDYILFGEDDLFLSEDYVEALMRCIDETEADIVGGRIFYSKKGESVQNVIRHSENNRGSVINYWMMSGDYSVKTSGPRQMPFLHAISLAKTDVCRRIRFDEAFFAREETDFYLRACKEGFKVMFCPDTYCIHLKRDRGRGGGWRVGPLKYQFLATKNNNMLVDRHYALLKKWGMKGNKFTFKLLHLINRIRILYLYHKLAISYGRYRIGFLMHGARNIGGGEQSISLLITHLNKDLFEPIVFYNLENNLIRDLRMRDFKVVRFPISGTITSVYRDQIRKDPLNLFLYVYHSIRGIIQTIRSIRKYEIDILHPHDNLSKIIGSIAAKFCRVKVVSHCRDQLGQGLMDKIIGMWQIMMMDRIIAVSNCVRNILLSYQNKASGKIKTIYNGVDFDLFKPKDYDSLSGNAEGTQGQREIVIGIIGVFDKVKGHALLFEALRRLKEENTNHFQCLVIGAGREEVALRNYVEESGMTKEINFLGFREDIPDLLKKIDIVVVPSMRESFCRVAIESMAAQVPVIATRVGGLPELIDHDKTGILVPPGDVESLSNAIKYLMEHPEARKRMGQEGRKKVENHFGLETNIRETEKIYLEVLRN